ncbi:hypothetical protein B0H15DRAFT_403362 [Mycena belliarum]|uniref:Uncharacterized protein n=1 Tax=Mycena belliarum TaxID=1033014 RepID=A0AAD6U435_9AGAR|nr:hypothetical protein B0H15DRAFT_42179 [Mycena belliae]KAJ7084005.1 hypothetical protein B0H15DRAFT_403362 [Mycena belliae]
MSQEKAADEEQLLALEEQFRELTLKEAEMIEQLTEVRAAKQRVRRLVAVKKNHYASIFTLPDELLVLICQAGQQLDCDDSDGPRIEVMLSHVSQRLRWVSLAASCLWSSVELHWGVEADEARFATYLERSRAQPLSVACKYGSYGGSEECDYDAVPNALSTVAHNISRIRRLVLQFGGMGMSLDDGLAYFCDLRAPCLEYVEISALVSELDDPDQDNYASVFTRGAPHLTTLKLNNVFPDYWTSLDWLPFLTSLDLRGYTGTITYVLSLVLSSCVQLIDLTLDNTTYFACGNHLLGGTDVYLPSLRTLIGVRLDSDNHGSLGSSIIPYLHAPALETLQLSGVHGTQISALFTLLSPGAFPALRSLTFVNSRAPCIACPILPERILPEALRHFTVLASLTIVNVCHVGQLLSDLLATSKDEGSLSALRTLSLRHKDADVFGLTGWPKLPSASPSLDEPPAFDPLPSLRTLVTSFRKTRPLRLRLARSRFFTERDWDQTDAEFEMFDSQQLLQSLGYSAENDILTIS